jgi:acetyl-CoA acetyltransferase
MANLRRVAAVGVGYSTVGRKTGLSERTLAAQAARAALTDAGLEAADVDGVSTWGGDAVDFGWMLGMMPLSWFSNCGVGAAFSNPAIDAIAAIQAGLCDTAMAFRVIKQQPSAAAMQEGTASLGVGVDDMARFLFPHGVFSPVQWAGLMTQRYMAEYGATEEMFGAHVCAQRAHAVLNDDALQRTPLSLEEYLACRYVSEPVRLLDCDYPCDSGSAVIFTTEERARDAKQPPVFVDSYSLAATHDLNFEIMPDMVRTAPVHCAEKLWSRTDLRPSDIDCAQLYDGFSIIVFQWLEALGFCEPGGAGPFMLEGNTRLGGSLPVNTDGGACNVGRRHGANFCIEAVRQLRGESGERQVAGARSAVWANAVGPFAGAVLMTNQ